MEFKNVVVTGGAGFIGSHLVDALVPLCKKVVVIDKQRPKRAWKNTAARYKLMDVQDTAVEGVIARYKPDVVFHLAAHIHDRESVHEPVMNAQDNVIGLLRVAEATAKYGKKLVFASTSVVYGDQQVPIAVTAPLRPMTPYGISKLTGERYLRFYEMVHGLPFVALRLGNVYGPRQDSSAESGAVGIFATRFLKGEQVFVNNDVKTTRDYVYVTDVVDALLAAATTERTGVFNVATGVGTTTLDVFNTVASAVGVHAQPDFREDVPDVFKHVVLDVSATTTDLPWQAKTSFV